MGLPILDVPRPATHEPLGPPAPAAISSAEVETVALAIEHLLVPGTLTYEAIEQLLAEGGVAPWLGVAGERKREGGSAACLHAKEKLYRRPPASFHPPGRPDRTSHVYSSIDKSQRGRERGRAARARLRRGGVDVRGCPQKAKKAPPSTSPFFAPPDLMRPEPPWAHERAAPSFLCVSKGRAPSPPSNPRSTPHSHSSSLPSRPLSHPLPSSPRPPARKEPGLLRGVRGRPGCCRVSETARLPRTQKQ